MKRLLKKIALTEGVDCTFIVQGNEMGGKIELILNQDVEKKHKNAWDTEENPSHYYRQEYGKEKNMEVIAYYNWSTNMIKNPLGKLPGENEYFASISGAVEIMEPYRRSNNPEDSIFNNVFDLLMKKLKEVCFEPLIQQFGEENVVYRGNFINKKLEQTYLSTLKNRFGIDMFTNIMKEKIQNHFNYNLENSDLYNLKMLINYISVDCVDLATLKIILDETKYKIEEVNGILESAYYEDGLKNDAIEAIKNGESISTILEKNR